MIRLAITLAATLACALAWSAGGDHAAPGHDHDHAQAHTGHDDAGPGHALGRVGIADVVFAVTSHGEVTAGGELPVQIVVEQGTPPDELRAWVGVRNGRGSVKALLHADDHGSYHGHLEVPADLPGGSALWLEPVSAAGRERGAVALPAAGHAHAADGSPAHDDHPHGADAHQH